MINQDNAVAAQVKNCAQKAIQELARIFDIEDIEVLKEYDELSQAVCKVISEIDASLLLFLYKHHPTLTDLDGGK